MTTQNSQHHLIELKPQKDFFVGIDSDGCVFDSMEIKHKECFIPAFIQHLALQKVSTLARETWEYVNLYSQSRGYNRFKALILTLKLLSERPEIQERGFTIPDMTELQKWIDKESKLGNHSLELELKANPHSSLERAYHWSIDVNAAIEKIVWGLGPFPQAEIAIKNLQGKADSIVVSQTPLEALNREWKENKIDHLVRLIAGQEMGTKTEHLQLATEGKYNKDQILMIGDAPGDLDAAQKNEVLFFPIIPGHENESWEKLNKEGLNHFFMKSFSGSYQEKLIREFKKSLPHTPPWTGGKTQ